MATQPGVTAPEHSVLRQAFDKYDTNKNGSIETCELESIFRDLRWASDAKTLNEALKILDKDNSGTIEWDEFLKWAEFTWKHKVMTVREPTADMSYDTLKFVN